MVVVFVAWRRLSERTRSLVSLLGCRLVFVPSDPLYVRGVVETLRVLRALRPDVVILQLPPGPLLAFGRVLRGLLGFRLVADVHTGMVVYSSLREALLNSWARGLLRGVDLVLAHNRVFAGLLGRLGVRRVLVVYDPLPRLEPVEEPRDLGLEPGGYILVPSSWAPDEPIEYIVSEYCGSSVAGRLRLIVTGDYRRWGREPPRPCNGVVYTGFLPRPQYNWLVLNAAAVVTGTTRSFTLVHATLEALAAGKPVYTTRSPVAEELLGPSYPGLYELKPGSLSSMLTPSLIDELEGAAVEARRRVERVVGESIQRLRWTLKLLESGRA